MDPLAVPLAQIGAAVHERWPIKTAADDAAALIDASTPTMTTIEWLRSQSAPAPDQLMSPSRNGPVETTVYSVTATLTAYKLESDQDYHLVLTGGQADSTIIAEIPDPQVADGSKFLPQITASRDAFEHYFQEQLQGLRALASALATAAYPGKGSVPMIQHATVPVTVTGIGFFDFIHGQTGVAPNGIELHPVIEIVFG